MPVENSINYREDFPFFRHQPEWCYLDNAATTQMPDAVISAMGSFEETGRASSGRGLYELSAAATRRIEQVRGKLAAFLGVPDAGSITFTSGTTESINLVARGYLEKNLKAGDQVIVGEQEHHANLIPWQQVCHRTGARLTVLPVDDEGRLQIRQLESLLTPVTKMVALTHISNALGNINDLEQISAFTSAMDIPLLLDLAQSVALHRPDLSSLNVAFAAFSGHKMFGPFGTGALYVHPRFQDSTGPWKYGGGMIREVSFRNTEFLSFPYNLEGGTPNVTGILGLGAAIDYVSGLPKEAVRQHITRLAREVRDGLDQLTGYRVLGENSASGILSFIREDAHPHDIAQFLAADKVAVRAGMHCAEPLMHRLGLPGTVRVSLSLYSNTSDVEKLLDSLNAFHNFWK